MVLRAPYILLAQRLQESVDAGDIWHNDLQRWLSDACSEIKPDGQQYSYCYLVDFAGDSESGTVVYSCNGDYMQAPYEIRRAGDKISADIDCANAVDVLPVTQYLPEAEDDDHVASMESDKLYRTGEMPLYERFISKAERKSAGSTSFAGKGKSFPILKAADVMAAVRSMGRAGSDNYDAGTLKKNIIRIAKEKGFEGELPKAWRGGDSAKESAGESAKSNGLQLVESAATMETIVLREAKADYEIKLIAPGKGSSAFYPAEVLKRDGPKVFGAGTHVYLNHPTAAEEAQRPEGDVTNLAGVLTTQAQYHEAHAKGPGLYARMKVFADHAQMVEEKASHVGMSIRASGIAEADRKQDGLPVLKELTHAESVDVVTKAGAGGMILTEAARGAAGESMDQTEVQKLVEAAVKAAQAPLIERAIRGDAREAANAVLATMSLRESAKPLVIDHVIGTDGAYRPLPLKDGGLDREAFVALVTKEAQKVGAALGSEGVRGMGVAAVDPVKVKEAAVLEAEAEAESIRVFESLGLPKDAAVFAAKGRAA